MDIPGGREPSLPPGVPEKMINEPRVPENITPKSAESTAVYLSSLSATHHTRKTPTSTHTHTNHVRRRLTEFSILVETMLDKAMRALLTRNRDLTSLVVETYEPRANVFENEIDAYCAQAIACLSPKARDLRFFLMALKMNTDLERIGDLATGVARGVRFLIERPQLEFHNELPHMAFTAVNMIRNSTRAFLTADTDLARKVCRMDALVDRLHARLIDRLHRSMQQDAHQVSRGLELIGIANRIERISDHATNMAEDVIFIEEGRSIRHKGSSG